MKGKKTKTRVNPVKLLRLIIIVMIICGILVGGGYMLGNRSGDGNRDTEISAVVLENALAPVSQLSTVTYKYTELGQYESSKDFYGTRIPFTTTKFIITFEGTIKAGVDMDKASFHVEEGKVMVTLPAPEILSHEIHQDSVKVFDEKNSIFNVLTVKDYAEFCDDQKKTVEKQARTKGLLTEARKQAVNAVEQLLAAVVPEDWEIIIE